MSEEAVMMNKVFWNDYIAGIKAGTITSDISMNGYGTYVIEAMLRTQVGIEKSTQHHVNVLATALYRVLLKAGVINSDADPNGPEILMFAEDYLEHMPNRDKSVAWDKLYQIAGEQMGEETLGLMDCILAQVKADAKPETPPQPGH